MHKIIFPLLILLSLSLSAQNLQLHYDFGEGRQYLTSTLEMFKPDDFGATFWFVDIDYCDGVSANSASMAYWEIARYITLPFLKNSGALSQVSATAQYNDGLNTFGGFGSVWLGGVSYPVDLKIVTIGTDVLLRKAENQDLSYQLTFVWFKPFFEGKLIFTGFCDLWGQANADFDADGTDRQLVLLTEPQIWFNVSKHLAFGSEIEISRNFVYGAGDALQVNATLGLKWEF